MICQTLKALIASLLKKPIMSLPNGASDSKNGSKKKGEKTEMATWYVDKGRTQISLTIKGETVTIPVSCPIRTLDNSDFRIDHPVKSIPSGEWYDPQVFPSGNWKISQKPIFKNEEESPLTAPYFIPTDANQLVDTWIVESGRYIEKTGHQVQDWGYGIHFSTDPYTLGCLKVTLKADLLRLVDVVNEAIDAGLTIDVVVA